MNLRIRPAQVSDVEELFDIRCSVLENHQSRAELAELDITPQTVAEMIRGGEYISILAETDEKPVGFTMAKISDAYIFACFVRPSWEKQGIGRKLMETTENQLAKHGIKRAWLLTGSESNLRAVGFYKRLGWEHTGFLDDGQMRFEKNLKAEQGACTQPSVAKAPSGE